MNLELYIAHKLLRGDRKSVSVSIVRIALVGIALGVAVMLLSIFVTFGFKNEITQKLTGFSSHINIVSYSHHKYYGDDSIEMNDTLADRIRELSYVKHVYPFVNKSAILKSETEINGAILYGVDSTYDWSFFNQNLTEGRVPEYRDSTVSNEILLSTSLAMMLGNKKVGDKVQAHFVQDKPRVRVFTISGLFNTGLKEYDELFVMCDMRHLQRVNGWDLKEVTGLAVTFNEMDDFQSKREEVEYFLPWEEGYIYKTESIFDDAEQIFDWLALLDMNVWIIIILLVTVAGFNMVSGLLILILEKTTMIGILKAMGMKNINLSKLFIYISISLTGKGLLWGNALALVLAGIQWAFQVIKLDSATYYMDTVPVDINIWSILILDVGVMVVCTCILLIPSMFVSRIKPLNAIRFE